MNSTHHSLKTFVIAAGLLSCTILPSGLRVAQSFAPPPQSAGGANCAVDLGFDQDGVLPSSQGVVYGSADPPVSETSVFSAGGGLLHVDSTGTPGSAWYQLPGAYDPAQDFTLEFRMQVFPGTDLYGIDFEVSDSVSDFEFGFSSSGISLPPTPTGRPFLPFDTTDGFHAYRVFSPGGTASYQLFIDGALVASNGVSPIGGDPGRRLFFGDGTGGGAGRADIDFVRYCQATPVCVTAPSGLISWWPGDGNAGDIAGGNHATLQGGVTFVPGVVGQAFSFDGAQSVVGTPLVLSYQNGATLDAWVRTTDNDGLIVSDGGGASPGHGMGLFVEPPGIIALFGSKGTPDDLNFRVNGPFVADNTFHHVTGTWTGDTTPGGVRLYLDGQLVGTGTAQTTITTGSTPFQIGWHTIITGHRAFAGLIDEVEIFNRPLTATEIQAIFDAGSAGKCKPSANRPAVAMCHDVTVTAGPNCTADASIDDGSFDPDQGDTTTLTQTPRGPYPLGDTTVTLTATDNHGASSSCIAVVTVTDHTPPTVAHVSATPSTIRPPNHKMVPVTINYDVADTCGPVTCALSVSSNEGTSADWQILDAHHLLLRAERLGGGNGRTYAIRITSTDASGNSLIQTVDVTVSHDQGH